jgi:ATP-dependent exoDNAse (exonuclease V) beta subunit
LPGLTIYKASAGSGKTHALVGDYLDIVFHNPSRFRHILAVTFTNKATAEMKQRIMNELSALADGERSDFREGLARKLNLSETALRERARLILNMILQNYSRFYIETIDTFFQRVIRSFAREIQLQASYTIELDENKVLEEAVDRMLSESDRNEFLKKWLTDFAEMKIREGQYWNLKNDILFFSSEIFKEKFRESNDILLEQLRDRGSVNRYRNELFKYKNWFENHLKELGERAMGIIHDAGLSADDFINKSRGPAGFFWKLSCRKYEPPADAVSNCLDNPDKWFSKTSGRKAEIRKAYDDGLNEILRQVVHFFNQNLTIYNSVDVVYTHLFSLGILIDVMKKISEYLDERNIFLITDASYFLKQIIGGNETPFIYEKTGNYFSHFMIDEFQDTSRMQWMNFKPLIENSLSLDQQNLVVGDVKQSIYRWRNSDWEILSEGIDHDFRPESIVFKSLTENRRSRENIISFNNKLFTHCRHILGDKFTGDHVSQSIDGEHIENHSSDNEDKISHGGTPEVQNSEFRNRLMKAYSDVVQEIPPDEKKDGGYVEVTFLEDEEEKTWEEKSEEKVIRVIQMLQDSGYEPRDIAILVRKKNEGKRIADALLEHKKKVAGETTCRFDLISDELLYLIGSSSVRLILSILKFLVDPDMKINRAELLNEYRRYLVDEDFRGDLHELFRSAAMMSPDAFSGLMPEGFSELIHDLSYLSLNEITEKIISLFGLHKRVHELSYLYAFQDIVLDYCRNEPPDIISFLTWWEEFGKYKSLHTSEEQNAIRVMTIHKAKGLQFRVVIVPYCSWYLDHKTTEILWCKPEAHPLNQISLVPVRYSSRLEKTIFRNDYLQERFRIHVDHLNLLYVALTRAQDCLYVTVPYEPDTYPKLTKISDLMGLALTGESSGSGLSEKFDMSALTWKLGTPGKQAPTDKIKPDTEFITGTVSNTTSRTRLRTRWHGTNFLVSGSDRGINKGKFIHEVLQSMVYADDLERALSKTFRDGKLNKAEMAEIRYEIAGFLNLHPVREWFSGDWKVLKERDIILPGGHLRRPDRVMIKDGRVVVIDYKSGTMKRQEHERQIREYMDLLRQMGYQDVKGYLCFVRLKEIFQIPE